MSLAAALLTLPSPCGGELARTPLDALRELPGMTDRIEHFGDWNRDGVPDLLVAFRSYSGRWGSIQVLCVLDGHVHAVLWEGPRSVSFGEAPPWDFGDVDGDGVPDLIVGLPGDSTAERHAGAVQVVSGATTQTIAVTYGSQADERYGSAVVFLGDLDDDGVGDYAVGSPSPGSLTATELRRRAGLLPTVGTYGKHAMQQMLDVRGDAPGRVHARSGADQRVLWIADGTRAGNGFGETLVGLGDLDGDCRADLLVRCSSQSVVAAAVLSGRTGGFLDRIAHQHAPCGNAGDFDGDGMDDVFLDTFGNSGTEPSTRGERASVISGRTRRLLAQVDYPDWGGSFGTTVGVGDLDGDGFAELALGEPDFNLPVAGSGSAPVELETLRHMTLEEALVIESRPMSMASESGALRVVSGRTRRPIWGVWGRPGTQDSIGFSVCSIPDISGDGAPDLVVGGSTSTFVFEGPGGR
jgi:hypothetical protein